MRKHKSVEFIERNIHGAWVIYGVLGYRQYYDYTKTEAKRLYEKEAEETYWSFCNVGIMR